MKVDLSVIIPIYNIEKSIESLIRKFDGTFEPSIEVILVDDGSIDNTFEKAQELISISNIFRLYTQNNAGPGVARNKGLDHAKGEYVMFVDADDDFNQEMFSFMHSKIVQYSADMLQVNYYKESESSNLKTLVSTVKLEKEITNIETFNDLFVVKKEISPYLWTKIIKKSCISNIKFPSLYYSEDQVFIAKLINNCEKIKLLPNAFYTYKFNENSIVRQDFNVKQLDSLVAMNLLIEYYKESNLKFVKYFYAKKCRYIIYFFNNVTPRDNIILADLRSEFITSFNEYKRYSKNLKAINYSEFIWFNLFRYAPIIIRLYYKFKSKFKKS